MNILIDFTQIPIQKVGIGIYALNLINQLHRIDHVNKYFIVAQDDDSSLNFIKNSNFCVIKIKSKFFRKFILRIFIEQLYIPFLTMRHTIDAVHSLHYSFPLFMPVKKIVTIPDMTFYKLPNLHIFIKRHYFKYFIYLSSFCVDKIITISKSSRDDFLETFPFYKKEIEITHLGKDEAFSSHLQKPEIDKIKSKYKIKDDYFLFVGTIEPRKNIGKLISAFNKFLKNQDNVQLVIIGKKGWHFDDVFDLVNQLSLQKEIIFTGFITEVEKMSLMRGAKIFIYPSLYEGFGIPVLEALACGIPTITSNISSMPEIAGDAAVLIDPYDEEELYHALKKLYCDTSMYLDLKQKSTDQAMKFSWDSTARNTLRVYNSLQNNGQKL
ncbi:glycosyltransferase family 4 protein [Candidatus Omnitrophota bacterium]